MTHQRESLLMYSSEASSSGVAGEVTSTYTRRQFSLMPDAAAALCQSVTSCCCWRLPLLSTLLLLPVPPSVSLSPAAAAAGVAGALGAAPRNSAGAGGGLLRDAPYGKLSPSSTLKATGNSLSGWVE